MNQIGKCYVGFFKNASHILLIVLEENCISNVYINLIKCT